MKVFSAVFLADAVLRGLKIETVWWNCLSVPIFICMQIEEFSHLTGKLVFGFLLVILIYYEIFLCRSVKAYWRLNGSHFSSQTWDGKKGQKRFKFMQNMASLQNRFIVDDSGEKIDCEEFNKSKD